MVINLSINLLPDERKEAIVGGGLAGLTAAIHCLNWTSSNSY
jgi:succinate dehydrogenase/fumarate reductase flavoprotein subunit